MASQLSFFIRNKEEEEDNEEGNEEEEEEEGNEEEGNEEEEEDNEEQEEDCSGRPRRQSSSVHVATGGRQKRGPVQSILLRLCVGESVMTSLQGAGPRLRLAVESKWSAISSAMKVLRSTSWRPFLRRLCGWVGWVGEPGGPERTEMLAMAPLRPCRAMASLNGCRSVSTELPVSGGDGRLEDTMATLGGARAVRGGGTLPHRKLMRSSRLMVLLRFFTQAMTSLLRRWWPKWMPRS